MNFEKLLVQTHLVDIVCVDRLINKKNGLRFTQGFRVYLSFETITVPIIQGTIVVIRY